VPDVARAEERHPRLELPQQPHQLGGERGQRVLVLGREPVHLPHLEAVLRVEVAPPEHVVAERLQQQPLEDVRVLALGPQKDGREVHGGLAPVAAVFAHLLASSNLTQSHGEDRQEQKSLLRALRFPSSPSVRRFG
jgi:hypothetical protein